MNQSRRNSTVQQEFFICWRKPSASWLLQELSHTSISKRGLSEKKENKFPCATWTKKNSKFHENHARENVLEIFSSHFAVLIAGNFFFLFLPINYRQLLCYQKTFLRKPHKTPNSSEFICFSIEDQKISATMNQLQKAIINSFFVCCLRFYFSCVNFMGSHMIMISLNSLEMLYNQASLLSRGIQRNEIL